MAEPLTSTRPTLPHHGPVRPGCPVECLLPALSLMSFNRLRWAEDPPRTVGEVMGLLARHQLGDIRGLGPRRITEIQAALVLAGLDLDSHQQLLAQPGRNPRGRRGAVQ